METETSWNNLEYFDQKLQEFETASNIYGVVCPDKVKEYINLDIETLHKLGNVEVAEIGFMLTRFSLYLQKVYNKNYSRVQWAESRIKDVVANELNQYKAWSLEEKRMLAVKNNEVANKLNMVKMQCEARCNRLNMVSAKVDALCKSLSSLQQARRN